MRRSVARALAVLGLAWLGCAAGRGPPDPAPARPCRPVPGEVAEQLRSCFEDWVAARARDSEVSDQEVGRRREALERHLACDAGAVLPAGPAPCPALAQLHGVLPRRPQMGAQHPAGDSSAAGSATAAPAPAPTRPPFKLRPRQGGATAAPRQRLPECIPDLKFLSYYPSSTQPWHSKVCSPGFEREGFPFADPFVPASSAADARDPPLARLARLLAGHTVALTGDSMMRQLFDAADCEGRRAGLVRGGAHAAALQARLQRQAGPAPPGEAAQAGALRTLEMRAGPGHAPVLWVHRFDPHLEAGVGNLWRAANATVALVNAGLHYLRNPRFDREAPGDYKRIMRRDGSAWYDEELRNLLARVGYDAPEVLPIWVETAAQHFKSATGTGWYDPALKVSVGGCQCAPIDKASAWEGSVNAVAEEILKENPRWRVLPFFNLTAPRHAMHHARLDVDCSHHDCTHLCYSPHFYNEVFRVLAETLLDSDYFSAT